jgi:drug/metabolite transporter (DMT)-like permease
MAVSLYLIPITMISVVFIYKNFTGENLLALDIVAFFLTISIAQYVFVRILKNFKPSTLGIVLSLIFVVLIITAFALFSHFPPAEPDIFIDPMTGRYGIN